MLKNFNVSVELVSEYETEVLAESKADAEAIAKKEAKDSGPYGLDFDIAAYAREVNQ